MIRIGIICPSEIAFRRFLPALQQAENFTYVGVAVATRQEWFSEDVTEEKAKEVLSGEQKKAEEFQKQYGGKIFQGYESLLASEEIDAVYLPLPPALHFQWGKKALAYGKHLFMEKPFATSEKEARELLALAEEKELAVHENYMFVYHDQLKAIQEEIESKSIGEVRLYRISFGFPRRAAGDFRYNKALGGGAILDAGGYTLKYAAYLLGEDAKLMYAKQNYTEEFEVDLFGSAVMESKEGLTAEISFGMDNAYKCDLEVWGSKGTLYSGRVLTAPAGFVPTMTIKTAEGEVVKELPPDDTFKKSLEHFESCVMEEQQRKDNYETIQRQAQRLQAFLDFGKER